MPHQAVIDAITLHTPDIAVNTGDAAIRVEHLETGRHGRSHNALTLNTLASTLAHELRSPLASISGKLQLMGGSLEDGHPHRELVEEAIHQVDRVTRELDDLLAYARPAQVDRSNEVDLGALVRRVVAFLGAQARADGVDLVATTMESCPVSMRGDGNRLEQIVLNLVQNAVHAASAGEEGSRRVDVAVSLADGVVQMVVSDTGVGIDPSDRERVFEPFYTTRAEGTGLGLPIVRRLVEAHRGRVHVTTASSGGAEFIVRFPASEDASES